MKKYLMYINILYICQNVDLNKSVLQSDEELHNDTPMFYVTTNTTIYDYKHYNI